MLDTKHFIKLIKLHTEQSALSDYIWSNKIFEHTSSRKITINIILFILIILSIYKIKNYYFKIFYFYFHRANRIERRQRYALSHIVVFKILIIFN